MTRYKVTAEPIKHPMFYNATSEDEAWQMAKQTAKWAGLTLYNGKVEKEPSDFDIIAAQAARIAELEAALAPFATAANVMHPSIEDMDGIWTQNGNHEVIKITAGDCRRARALLEKSNG